MTLKNRENKLGIKDMELNLINIPGIKMRTEDFFLIIYSFLYYSFCFRFTIKGNEVHFFISQEMWLNGY